MGTKRTPHTPTLCLSVPYCFNPSPHVSPNSTSLCTYSNQQPTVFLFGYACGAGGSLHAHTNPNPLILFEFDMIHHDYINALKQIYLEGPLHVWYPTSRKRVHPMIILRPTTLCYYVFILCRYIGSLFYYFPTLSRTATSDIIVSSGVGRSIPVVNVDSRFFLRL